MLNCLNCEALMAPSSSICFGHNRPQYERTTHRRETPRGQNVFPQTASVNPIEAVVGHVDFRRAFFPRRLSFDCPS